jgi:hypothetical protein
MPWAAIVWIVGVAAIELSATHFQDWFADLAAWQWETKHRMLDAGQLNGDVAVVGSSILFHGFDPTEANADLKSRERVVNLALNGQTLQHSAQLLERRLAEDSSVRMVVLELWNLKVEPESWLGGPYFRSWATWEEFLESGLQYNDPSVLVSFAAYRALPTFRYREGLNNWISSCLQTQWIDTSCRERNDDVAKEMLRSHGFAHSTAEADLLDPQSVPQPVDRPWHVKQSAVPWIDRIVDACRRRGVEIVLFVPPAPPFVERDRERSAYYAGFEQYSDDLQRRFPGSEIETLRFAGYDLSDFSDDHHYSCRGQRRLSNDLARWITARSTMRDMSRLQALQLP